MPDQTGYTPSGPTIPGTPPTGPAGASSAHGTPAQQRALRQAEEIVEAVKAERDEEVAVADGYAAILKETRAILGPDRAPDWKDIPAAVRKLLATTWSTAAHAGHGSPCETRPDGSCAAPAVCSGAGEVTVPNNSTSGEVRALLTAWLAAGPPPLGTSIDRWWDQRLVELAAALGTSADTTKET